MGNNLLGGECNDADTQIHPLSVRHTDADADGFTAGSSVMQCTAPANTALASSLVDTSLTNVNIETDLIHHWTFDDADGTDRIGGNYATRKQDANFTVGQIETAANFNGGNDAMTLDSTINL